MRYAIVVADGERVITRVPDPEPEDMVLADSRNGIPASNPPGSFEVLCQALGGTDYLDSRPLLTEEVVRDGL